MGRNYEHTAFAFETLTVSSGSTPVSLSGTVYSPPSGLPARYAHLTVDTVSTIRYGFGGFTVNWGTGHFATPTDIIEINGNQQIRDFRLIAATSATAAQVSVSYFR